MTFRKFKILFIIMLLQLVGAALSFLYPVHSLGISDYFSTTEAKIFWIGLSVLICISMICDILFLKMFSKDALNFFDIGIVTLTTLVAATCSFSVFDFVNTFNYIPPKTVLAYRGFVESKEIRKYRRRSTEYLIFIRGEGGKRYERAVNIETFEKLSKGSLVSSEYGLGRLGIPFQNGCVDKITIE